MYVTLDLKSDFWEIVNFVTGKFVMFALVMTKKWCESLFINMEHLLCFVLLYSISGQKISISLVADLKLSLLCDEYG